MIDNFDSDEHICLYCRHCYDVWPDGTAKCDAAHGGIIMVDSGSECKVFEFDD